MRNKKAFILPVILLVLVFIISCSTKETAMLDNITLSTDSHPEFVLKSSKNMSEKQISKDERIKDALNKAITDYPELSSMLEADMIDGGSNNYIYEGSEPFFKTLNEFTDENFKKAKSMFPEITEDEFIYNAAIGYGIANKGTQIQINTEVLLDNLNGNGTTKYLNIEESVTSSFWALYLNSYFDNNIRINNDSSNNDVTLNSPADIKSESEQTLILYEYFKLIYHEKYVAKKLINKEVYYKLGSKEQPNYALTGLFLEKLSENPLFQFENLEMTDHFIEIGIESLILNYLLSGIKNNQPFRIGHVLGVSTEYLAEICKTTFTISKIESDNIGDTFVGDVFNNNNLETASDIEPWRNWFRWKKDANIDFYKSIRTSGKMY